MSDAQNLDEVSSDSNSPLSGHYIPIRDVEVDCGDLLREHADLEWHHHLRVDELTSEI